MKRVPANRYVVFCLLAGAGLFWDLHSKGVVFTDLGYPGRFEPPVVGEHQIFSRPHDNVEGESVLYMEGWTSFRLFTSFNRGALWGVGQGYSWAFAALSVLAIVGVLCWLFLYGAATSKWLTVSLGMIMAGTLGNLYDRLAIHGYIDPVLNDGTPLYAVRDFLLFTFGTFHWPVFNFADVYLVSGAIMLVLHSFVVDPKATNGNEAESTKQLPHSATSVAQTQPRSKSQT